MNKNDGLPPRLLSIEEAAKFMQVSTTTVRRIINRGEIKTIRIIRQIRIDPADLRDFLTSNKSKEG